VLCDRYSDSTLAYQLAARKLGKCAAPLREMLSFAECGVTPGLTLWFNVSVKEAMRRMKKRAEAGEKASRLDEEAESFHERVSAAFEQQYELDCKRIVRLDAAQSMDDVGQQVRRVIDERYGWAL